MERELQEVLSAGEGDGQDILCQLLQVKWRVNSLLERLSCGVLQMPRCGEVPDDEVHR